MSNNVDEKVVSLKFDAEQFQKGSESALKMLESLNKTLQNFAKNTSEGKVFDSLAQSINKTDFSAMQSGVDTIANRFTNLGLVGVTAIQNITNKAVDSATKLVKSLTIDPVSMGFSEYELKMSSIRTIMSSTGESIETVNGYLNDLNKYSDETIYSFSDMTNNIGKFTNAGVNLKQAVSAIKGVSNVAAISGANAQEASRAMYNFSQALSAGHVKLMDWKSIENANMATKSFKEQLIQTAVATGDLTKKGKAYVTSKGTEITATKNFNESLQEGWMTTKVLTRTLRNYSVDVTQMSAADKKAYEQQLKRQGYTKKQIEEIEKLGTKAMNAAREVTTWTKMVDALQEAVQSGWAQTFEIIFGNIEEAKVLWTGINDVVSTFIGNIDAARNNLLQTWKDAGGRTAMLNGIANVLKYIGSMLKPIGKAFREIFPPASGKALAAATKKFENFTKTLKLSKETAENIKDTFKGVFAVVGFFKDVITSIIKAFLPSLDIFGSVGAMIVAITGAIGRFMATGVQFIRNTKAVQTIFAGIGIAVKAVVFALRLLSKAFVKVLTVTTKFTNGIFEKILGYLLKFINVVKKAGNAVKDYFVGVFNKYASPAMKAYATLMGGVIKNIAEQVKEHKHLSKATGVLKEDFKALGVILSTVFDNKKQKAKEFFKSLSKSKEVEGLKLRFILLGKAIKAISPIILKKIENAFVSLFDKIKNLHIIERLAAGVSALIDKLAKLALAVHDNFKPMDTLKQMLDPKSFIAYGKAAEGAGKNVEKAGKAAKGVVDSKDNPMTRLDHLLAKAKDALKNNSWYKELENLRDKIHELFESFDIDQTIDRGFGITKIIATLAMVKQSGKLVSSAAGVMDSLSSVLLSFSGLTTSLSNLAKQAKTNLKINAFKTIAISIGIVVASVYLLSQMSSKELLKGLGAAALVFAALLFTLKQLTSENIDANKLKATGLAFAGVGAAMLMIAVAANIFASMKVTELMKAGDAIAAFMAAFIAAGRLAVGSARDLVGFLAVSAAVALLVPSIIMLSKLSFGTMVRGGAAIVSFILLIGIASRAASKERKGFAVFFAVAGAVATLVPAIIALSILPLSKALKAAFVLSELMLVLGGAVRLASSGGGGSAFMVAAMGAMIAGLTASLMALAFVPFTKLLKGMVALSATMLILSKTAATMELEKTKIVGLTAILAILAASMYLMGSIDIRTAGVNMVGMAALLASIAFMCDTISLIPFGAAMKGLGVGMAFLTGLIGFLAILGAISTASKGKLAQFASAGAEIGKYVGLFVGNIIGGIGEGLSNSLPAIGKNLSDFMKEIQPFLDAVETVSPEVAAGAKNIASAILYITAAEFLNALNTPALGPTNETGIDVFAKALTKLMGELAKMETEANKIENFDNISKCARVISQLAKAAAEVPTVGGIRGKIMGVHDLSGFAESLKDIMPVLGSMHKEDEKGEGTTIKFGYIRRIAGVLKALGEAAQEVPETSWVRKKITGIHDLGDFGKQLASFIGKLNGIAGTLNDDKSNIDRKSLNKIENVADTMAALGRAANKIPADIDGDSLKAKLEGSKDLGEFAKGMESIAGVLPGLVEASAGLDKDAVSRVGFMADIIISVADASNKISTISGGKKKTIGSNLQKDITKLAQFATKMKDFVPNFKAFAEEAGKIDETDLQAANIVAKSMNSIAGAYKKLVESGGWKSGGDDMVSKLSSLAKAMKSYAKNINDMEVGNLKENSSAVVSSIKSISKQLNKTGSFKKAGTSSITAYTKSLSNDKSITSANSAGKSIAEAAAKGLKNTKAFSSAGKAARDAFVKGLKAGKTPSEAGKSIGKSAADGAKGASFYSAGKSGAEGFASGLRDHGAVAEVASAGTALGNAAYKAAKRAIKSKSPSKKFMELGKYSDEGFAIGLMKYSDLVYKEGERTGEKAVKGARTGYEHVIDEINNPTIKPVIDLSDVRKGANDINGILSATGTDVNTAMVMNSLNRQNGVAETMKLASKLDKVADRMTEQQPSKIYNIGDVTVDVSKLEDVTTLNDFVGMLRHAKAFN